MKQNDCDDFLMAAVIIINGKRFDHGQWLYKRATQKLVIIIFYYYMTMFVNSQMPTYSDVSNACWLMASTTALNEILDVNVWPW